MAQDVAKDDEGLKRRHSLELDARVFTLCCESEGSFSSCLACSCCYYNYCWLYNSHYYYYLSTFDLWMLSGVHECPQFSTNPHLFAGQHGRKAVEAGNKTPGKTDPHGLGSVALHLPTDHPLPCLMKTCGPLAAGAGGQCEGVFLVALVLGLGTYSP